MMAFPIDSYIFPRAKGHAPRIWFAGVPDQVGSGRVQPGDLTMTLG